MEFPVWARSLFLTDSLFQSKPVNWSLVGGDGVVVSYEVLSWSYSRTNPDQIRLTVQMGLGMDPADVYLTWTGNDTFEITYTPDSTSPRTLVRLRANTCNPGVCRLPMQCTGANPPVCVFSNGNRKPGDTAPIPTSSAAFQLLLLLNEGAPTFWVNGSQTQLSFRIDIPLSLPGSAFSFYDQAAPEITVSESPVLYWAWEPDTDTIRVWFTPTSGMVFLGQALYTMVIDQMDWNDSGMYIDSFYKNLEM